MFGGSQVQMPLHASMNGILTFRPWYHHSTIVLEKTGFVKLT